MHTCADMLKEQFSDITFSPVYQTTAQLEKDQDDFLNACARFETDLSPEDIHGILKEIENTMHKAPPYRYGPRTIDLDLLLSFNANQDSVTLSNDDLVLPHPRMHERRFVLEPLCELIDPESLHPTLAISWENLLKKNLEQECLQNEIIL